MKAKIYLSSFFLWSAVLLFKGYGQCTTNMLINPSFEAPVQPNIGDNEIGSPVFNGWTMPGGTQFNIIRANGTVYGEGPDTAQQGKQYADVVKADGMIQQSFALTCPSAIDFSGYFSRREPGIFYCKFYCNRKSGSVETSYWNYFFTSGELYF
jgi:hypothetical protein